jgi:BrnA antitoxin of type II toxin-antitoxin system
LTLRVDADVVDWFQNQAAKGGYQTEMNRVLREAMQRGRRKPAKGVGMPRDRAVTVGGKSAIVTARKPKAATPVCADPPDTPDEHRHHGDAADALFREMKQIVAGKGQASKPRRKRP